MAPVRGKKLVQGLHRFRGELGQLPSVRTAAIGREHARTAGIRHDSQPRSFGSRLLREHFRHVEQIGDRLHPQYPRPPECRVEHLVASGESARMRRRRLSGRLCASCLDYDDRLAQRNFPRRREKRARIAHRLHVHNDALRAWIIPQVVDQVAPVDIEHRSDRYEGAKADHLFLRPIQNRRTQRPALADEAYVSRARNARSEGGVQPADGIHHAQAIRPN